MIWRWYYCGDVISGQVDLHITSSRRDEKDRSKDIARRGMADRRGITIKERKNIYAKRWRVENRDNPVASWYTSSKIWRKVKDNRVSDKELLVVRSNKRCGKIYGEL